jgi:hypothetical protein
MAEENVSKPIEVVRAPFRQPLQFETAEQLEVFLGQEKALWAWTQQAISGPPDSFVGLYRQNWIAPIEPLLTQWKNADPQSAENARQSISNQLNQRFRERQLLSALDPEAAALSELAKTSPQMAGVALMVVMGRQQQIPQEAMHSIEAYRIGVAKGLAILAGIEPSVTEGLKISFASVIEATKKDAATLRRSITTFDKSAASSLSAADDAAKQLFINLRKYSDHQTAEQELAFSELENQLDGTRNAYEKFMELEGPVRYWRGRGRENLRSAKRVRNFLIFYAFLATGVLYFLFDHAAKFIPAEGQSVPYAALFKVGAFTLLVTTAIFWIGRILLRVYFSDRHLAKDAEERRTMIMTFLALAKKNNVADDDRKLVLSAIFRPGADGIVKEDSGPDTAAATLIAGLFGRKG